MFVNFFLVKFVNCEFYFTPAVSHFDALTVSRVKFNHLILYINLGPGRWHKNNSDFPLKSVGQTRYEVDGLIISLYFLSLLRHRRENLFLCFFSCYPLLRFQWIISTLEIMFDQPCYNNTCRDIEGMISDFCIGFNYILSASIPKHNLICYRWYY